MKSVLYIGTRVEAFTSLQIGSNRGEDFRVSVLAIEGSQLDEYIKELDSISGKAISSQRIKLTALEKLENELNTGEYDTVISVGFPYILPADLLQNNKNLDFYNLHPHILPKWKGANAIKESIKAGETLFGATFHHLTEVLDEGEAIFSAYYKFDTNDLSRLYDSIFSIIEPHVMLSAIQLLKKKV
jgi:methionyl-tRNA formyltransferase